MRISVRPLLFSVLVIIAGCSKKDNNNANPSNPPAPVLTTTTATNITSTSADIGGNITSAGYGTVVERGVVVGLNSDPSVNSNDHTYSLGSGTAAYTVTCSTLTPGTTYHARAYAINNVAGIGYGNDITFSTPSSTGATTLAPTDILVSSARFRGNNTAAAGVTISGRGFVYSTNPNPQLNGSFVVTAPVSNGDYSVSVQGLQPNTTYYVRAYSEVYASSSTSYGAELSFKTTGYNGPTGGLVFYDKGEVTNGWRYMELAPTDISISSNSQFIWGCDGQVITQTNTDYGTGLDNTDKIVAGCSQTGAGKLAKSYSFGGKTDWFLPSRDEGIAMLTCLKAMNGLSANIYFWTSSETSASDAYYVYLNSSNNVVNSSNPKYNYEAVRPIRYY